MMMLNARLAPASRRLVAPLLILATLVAAALGSALSARADQVLLVVSRTGGSDAAVSFTESDLRALPQHEVRTATEFTDGKVTFRGPLARDVLDAAGLGTAETAHMVAANDYAVDVPVRDFGAYEVIMAMEANGKPLSRRDKGPIWLIYPIDSHAELRDPVYTIRLIWQLTRVELR